MNADTIIKSKLRWFFPIIEVALYLIVITIIGLSIVNASTLGMLLSLVIVGFHVVKIWHVGIVRYILVAPNELVIRYYVTGKQLTLPYTEIDAIHSTRASANQQGGVMPFSRKQELEMNDGRVIIYGETQFENFEEIKSAIWQYRLDAFKTLNERNSQHN